MISNEEIQELKQAILERIAMDEVFADEMAAAAHDLRRGEGDAAFAAALVDLSRRHSVRSMLGRAELAAIKHQYRDDGPRREDPGS